MSPANNKTVQTLHPAYTAMQNQWQRCRDVAGGQDAVFAAGVRYLPKLAEQTPEAYQSYLTRATFYNATWRTISGFVGMLFRKPETVDVAPSVKPMLADITMGGEPLHIFVQELAEECFTVGRVGVLVDYPAMAGPQVITVAMAQAMGLRPVLQRYTAEAIINWRVGAVNNQTQLLMVVLTEDTYMAQDEFTGKTETRYRVLDLVTDPSDQTQMAYRVRLFRIHPQSDAQEQIGPDTFPLLNNQPLREIPFVFLGVDSITPKVDTPPLIDLVDLNLAHFRVAADYEHGCHFTGLPTPVVAGYSPTVEGEKLYLGSSSAWVFPDPATKAHFLEFSGAGLGALERNLDRKEQQMAAIGARLLAFDQRRTETATTAAIHHGGETSILAAVAQVLSLGMTRALTIFSQWAGIEAAQAATVQFAINRDFVPVPMDASTLQSLVAAWQAGALSYDALFARLQQGEVLTAETTVAQEVQRISSNLPPRVINSPTLTT